MRSIKGALVLHIEHALLVSAKDEVYELASDALVMMVKIPEPREIVLEVLLERVVSVRATHTKHSAWLQTAIKVLKMAHQILVRKVLNHMVRIKDIYCLVVERKRIHKVCPDVAFRRHNIGVYVNPIGEVVFLTRTQLDSHKAMGWGTQRFVQTSIQQHRETHYSIIGRFQLSTDHVVCSDGD